MQILWLTVGLNSVNACVVAVMTIKPIEGLKLAGQVQLLWISVKSDTFFGLSEELNMDCSVNPVIENELWNSSLWNLKSV